VNDVNIVIASGKGGTGKTLIATNLAIIFDKMGKDVTYLDCDVEEPDGHLLLKPQIDEEKPIMLQSPVGVDPEKCIGCGKCAEVCTYNAIAVVKEKALFFPELCHVCGACTIVCPTDAIVEKRKKIGELKKGRRGNIGVTYALLETGEGGMSPRLINAVKEHRGEGVTIIDSPPGTACPAVESVAGADLAVLVTDPTPFGINDLKLSVNMCREIGIEPVVLVNRAEYRDRALKTYCDEAGLEIIGEIPDDRKVAEVYSTGDLIVEELEEYTELFKELAQSVEEAALTKRELTPPEAVEYRGKKVRSTELRQNYSSAIQKPPELVIISGKGGTGKTSLLGAFASLAENAVLSDCDVDAADLHILTDPTIKERGLFSGGYEAEIIQDKCTHCGICERECRFDAITTDLTKDSPVYEIDAFACEGCGVCSIVCPEDAVELEEATNGEWFISDTRFGPMSHAKLGIAEENSGRLVTLVRQNAAALSDGREIITVDGAPGTGCPVIASLNGADYAVIVTEPTVSGIHDMKRVLDVTKHFGIKTGVVVNKSDLNKEKTEEIQEIARRESIEVLGEIPYDTIFTEAQMERRTVIEYTDNATTQIVKNLWEKVRKKMTK
jgi:MinD superfamily P-loop ATPase